MSKIKNNAQPTGLKEIKRRSVMQEAFDRLIRNKTAMAGFAILCFAIIICALAGVICPEGYDAQDITKAFTLPCKEYPMGTDNLGRSMLARILYGGRISLLVGVVSTANVTSGHCKHVEKHCNKKQS